MSNQDNQNHDEGAVASVNTKFKNISLFLAKTFSFRRNVKSSPKIFKLNIDCFNEIFEYLSVKDLHSFGQAWKEMNSVAGEYFKQNYSSAENRCVKSGIYTVYPEKYGVMYVCVRTKGFYQFMPFISLENNNMSVCHSLFRYIQSHVSEFKSTNRISFKNMRITEEQINFIKKLLPQLEIVEMNTCFFDGDFYELMLKYCENLKEFYVYLVNYYSYLQEHNKRHNIRHKSEHNWLLHKYPKLECLQLLGFPYRTRIEELREFFVINPNVQRFSTSVIFFWEHIDIFLNSNVKLDVLELKDCYHDIWLKLNKNFKDYLDLLNRLHEQGFYKRLHFYNENFGEAFSSSLASIKGLELFCIGSHCYRCIDLCQFTNLKELIILRGSNEMDLENLANSLVKLERLYIEEANIDDIMPFVCRSPRMKQIKVIPPSDDRGRVLNLTMLNREREKLEGANKITIYTRDDVFSATKWATENGVTNLNLIEMRRSDSYEWNHRLY